jgi:hypothetical protein
MATDPRDAVVEAAREHVAAWTEHHLFEAEFGEVDDVREAAMDRTLRALHDALARAASPSSDTEAGR